MGNYDTAIPPVSCTVTFPRTAVPELLARTNPMVIYCETFICIFLSTNRYVFKRLKFLGSKEASQGFTLLFLAIWHGLFSGYFMCFFLEFVIVNFERSVSYLPMHYIIHV